LIEVQIEIFQLAEFAKSSAKARKSFLCTMKVCKLANLARKAGNSQSIYAQIQIVQVFDLPYPRRNFT
jgi:hypothetical protein